MNRYVQFVGNYFNLNASYGETRTGEAILRIDLEENTLLLQIDGWAEKTFKLQDTTESKGQQP